MGDEVVVEIQLLKGRTDTLGEFDTGYLILTETQFLERSYQSLPTGLLALLTSTLEKRWSRRAGIEEMRQWTRSIS